MPGKKVRAAKKVESWKGVPGELLSPLIMLSLSLLRELEVTGGRSPAGLLSWNDGVDTPARGRGMAG
jgi:hypothetical protein